MIGGAGLRACVAGVLLLGAGIGIALALPKPATSKPAPSAYVPPRPMLWKVSDADNDIYLLGSFHVLKASDYPLAASVDAAFDDAEQVRFEVDPAEIESPDFVRGMLSAASLPRGRSLSELLDARDWNRLDAYARKRGLSLDGFRGFEPWFVSLQITLHEFSLLGISRENGLETRLIQRVKAARKPVGGLETGASQIALLDGMSQKQQRDFLSETLDESGDFAGHAEELHRLWRSGDVPGFEKVAVSEFRSTYPDLYKRMLVDRNGNWIPHLQELLDAEASDDTLVVVGAMHLVGPDGLVRLLKAKGYRVQRL